MFFFKLLCMGLFSSFIFFRFSYKLSSYQDQETMRGLILVIWNGREDRQHQAAKHQDKPIKKTTGRIKQTFY